MTSILHRGGPGCAVPFALAEPLSRKRSLVHAIQMPGVIPASTPSACAGGVTERFLYAADPDILRFRPTRAEAVAVFGGPVAFMDAGMLRARIQAPCWSGE